MPTGFHATNCKVSEEHGVLVTALGAPSTEEEDFYLMLQHTEKHDEQDVKFGMDKPYIEYCGQGWSWYGHILSFNLSRDRVRMQMDSGAAAHMRNDGAIEVTFDLNEAEFAVLRAAVGTTFNGQSYFTDEA
jgi:Immunity protein 10